VIVALAGDDSLDPPVLWAAVSGTGIFRSIDRGETWSRSDTGFDAGVALVNSVVSLGKGVVLAGETQFLYRSDDNGQSWEQQPGIQPSPYAPVTVLAADPVNPFVVYARGEGLYKSVDGGLNWVPIYPSPPTGFIPDYVGVDPSAPDTIYMAGRDNFLGRGSSFLKTEDGGQTWTLLNKSIPGPIAVLADQDRTVFAELNGELEFSTDRGASWTSASLPYTVNRLIVDRHSLRSNTLYAATSSGVYSLGPFPLVRSQHQHPASREIPFRT
jgi:photosystem II stability/assembly factor-like uncharacterized protein